MRRYVVAAAILVVLVWSSLGPGGPALTVYGVSVRDSGVTVGAVVPSVDDQRTVGVTGLCLTGGGAATITGVRLIGARGLSVVDFGVATVTEAGPEVPGAMEQSPRVLGYSREPVTRRCGADGGPDGGPAGATDGVLTVALAVSVRIADPARAQGASARGLSIRYLLDGVPGVLTVQQGVQLCVLPIERTDECGAVPDADADADAGALRG